MTKAYRKKARLKDPAWRVLSPIRNVAILVFTLLGVAAIIYIVIPGSSSGRTAATEGSGANSVSTSSTSNGRTVANGQAAHPNPLPSAPPVNGAPASAPAKGPGSGSLKPSNPAQASSWNAGSGAKALAGVTTLAGNVLMAHAIGQYAEMLQYCRALASAVQAAEVGPPITDAAMQKMYVKSLNAFKQGAADCVAGIKRHPKGQEDTTTDVNKAVLERAVSEFSLGSQDLYIATEALRKQ